MSNPEVKLKKSKRFGLAKYFIYCLFSIYLLVWLFSPFAINFYLADFLKNELGVKLSSNTGIRYNPFTSHLSINDLKISKRNQVVFAIESAEIEVRLHRLLVDQIYFSQLDISGLHIESKKQQQFLEVAGVDLMADASSNESSTSSSINIHETETLKSPSKGKYSIIIPSIKFDRKTLAFLLNDEKHHIGLTQVEVRDVLFTTENQKLELEISGKINDALLAIRAKLDLTSNDFIGNGVGFLEISLKGFELARISGLMFEKNTEQSITGKLDFESSFKVVSQSEKVTIDVSSINFGLGELSLTEKEISIALKQLFVEFNLPVVEIDLKADNPIDKISIPETTINLEKFNFSQPGIKASLDSSSVIIKPIELMNNRLSIDDILLSFGTAELLKSTTKNTRISSVLPEKQGSVSHTKMELDEEGKVRDEQQSDDDSISVLVEEILLEKEGTLTFEDQSVTPHFLKIMTLNKLAVNSLNSADPSALSAFNFSGSIDQYTKFEFRGDVKPFTQAMNLSLVGTLTELSLPDANGYVAPLMGFDFKSGNMDTTVEVKVDDSQLSGSTDVLIKGLDLSSAENHNGDVIEEQTALPLNVALGMLKDGDDNVELNIPMMGNIDSPTFGFGSFVSLVTKKAIQSAATSYLMKTFLPYAEILSVTLSAGDFIMKTRFEDLQFQPLQTSLAEEQIDFMEQFIVLMKDKKETRVKVCAVSTLSDLANNSLPDEQKIVKLQDVSSQRMNAFKSFATDRKIDSSRILLCKPQIDLEDSMPGRIEISI